MTSARMGFLLESINDQNRAVLEAVGDMQERIKLLATQESLDRLISEVMVIEAVVTNNRLEQHTGLR